MVAERQVPDVLLERFLVGDLSAEARRRIEEARAVRPEVRARLEELAAERGAFFNANPPNEFARRLAGELRSAQRAAPRRRVWLTWVLAPSAAAAVAVLVTFTVTRTSSDEASSVLLDVAPTASRPAPVGTPPASDFPAANSAGERYQEPAELAFEDEPRSHPKKVRKLEKKRPRLKKKVDKEPREPAREPSPDPEPPALGSPSPPRAAPEAEPAVDDVTADMAASSATAESTEMSLAERQIEVMLRTHLANLKPCLKASDEVSAGVHVLDLAWRIRATGFVKDPQWKGPASLRRTKLAACILEKMSNWRFPRADQSTPMRRSIRVTVR